MACVGDLLIDFVCTDIDSSIKNGTHFLKKAGGAPANVACCVAKLGGQAALAAKVGRDPFGDFLVETLKEQGVETNSVVVDGHYATSKAYVALQGNGERDFTFNWGASEQLESHELAEGFVENSKVVHFGAALKNEGRMIDLYQNLLVEASSKNKWICFDPNFRPALWENNAQEFVRLCEESLRAAHIVKVSEEELHILAGKTCLKESCTFLHQKGVKIILVTLGKNGTLLSVANSGTRFVDSIVVNSIDSTGAGDAFIGAFLYLLASKNTLPSCLDELVPMVSFANKVGALTCTQMGAISALPSLTTVESFSESCVNQ